MYLIENQAAKLDHDAGLRAEVAGDFTAAHSILSRALREVAPSIDQGFEPSSIDNAVQAARIMRDGGFTYVRETIASEDESLLDLASLDLTGAAEITKAIVDRQLGDDLLSFEHSRQFLGNKALHDNAVAEVYAEHGATLGLLGRAATVRQVMLGTVTSGNSDEAKQARSEDQKWYGRNYAHGALKRGNNSYYLVSNAMNGARQEVINGQRLRAGKWAGRAAVGLAMTPFKDRHNFMPAAKTFFRRLPHLFFSREAAKASVLLKP